MQVANTYKSFSSFFLEHPLESPRIISDLQTELRSTRSSVKAMRTVVSMLQQGYDLSILYPDVIKIIDTSDYELKVLCNFYLKSTCSDKPACHLMCTQAFRKDFNEINKKIQRLAVLDSVVFCDDILIKNYVNDIKRMCVHENYEIRQTTTRCLALFYLKNKELFIEAGMVDCLKALLLDTNIDVKTGCLNAFAVLEKTENILLSDDVLEIAKKFYERGRTIALKAALSVLKYKEMTDEAKSFYYDLLGHSDICVFYMASNKLIENGVFYGEVYDNCLFYMFDRPEQLYNLLSYILTFIDRVDIEVSDFLIFKTDLIYIKKLKMEILLKAMKRLTEEDKTLALHVIYKEYNYTGAFEDTISSCLTSRTLVENSKKTELAQKNTNDKEAILSNVAKKPKPLKYKNTTELFYFKQFIVYKAIKYNVHLETPFKNFKNEKILDLILDLDAKEISSEWQTTISMFLCYLNEVNDQSIVIKLALNHCSRVPKIIFKFESEKNCEKLVEFYVKKRDEGAITEQQCRNYLKNLQKKFPVNSLLKIVLLYLEKIKSDDICSKFYTVTEHSFEIFDFKLSENNSSKCITILDLLKCKTKEKKFSKKNCPLNAVSSNDTSIEYANNIDALSNLEAKNSTNETEKDNKGLVYETVAASTNVTNIQITGEHTSGMDKDIKAAFSVRDLICKSPGFYDNSASSESLSYTSSDMSSDDIRESTSTYSSDYDSSSPSLNSTSSDSKTTVVKEVDLHDTNITGKSEQHTTTDCHYDHQNTPVSIANFKNSLNLTDINEICSYSNHGINSSSFSFSEQIPTISSFPIYVNTAFIKGTIYIKDKAIILAVDILEEKQLMQCKVGSYESKNMVESEGEYTIGFVPSSNEKFIISIGTEKFEGNF